MDNGDEAEEAALRLEQALERIARLAQRPAPVANPAGSDDQGDSVIDVAVMAARLDALIAELRGALES